MECCNYGYSVCYLDLNNNEYYEEINTTVSTCNCSTLGVGWVSGDQVAEDLEVQGCTQRVNTGFSTIVDVGTPCPEYNPAANVDNGSCYL